MSQLRLEDDSHGDYSIVKEFYKDPFKAYKVEPLSKYPDDQQQKQTLYENFRPCFLEKAYSFIYDIRNDEYIYHIREADVDKRHKYLCKKAAYRFKSISKKSCHHCVLLSVDTLLTMLF